MNQLRNRLLVVSALYTAISGCSSLAPHQAYEQDKAPENRSLYQGMTGYKQFLKDETYLANHKQYENCQRYLLSLVNDDDSQQLSGGSLQGYKSACKGSLLEIANELERRRGDDES